MRILRLGLGAAVVAAAVLGLLWATEVVPREDLATIARMTFGGLAVLTLAGAAMRLVRGPDTRDATDRPVP